MIETRLLRSFLTVAEELHFGRAAARLHLTQPPLTRQIQQLEEELGVTLFDRTRRRVTLTEAGAAFAPEARRVLDQLARAAERTRRVARGEAGLLRIGFVSTADYSVLPALLKSFTTRFPEIEVELREATGDEQLERLRDGSLDAGVLIAGDLDPSLESLPLHRESLVAVLPRGHRLARRTGALPVRALRDEPFVLFPRPLAPTLWDAIVGYTGRAGFGPTIAQEARQMQTIIGLVAGTLGVSIVPACMRALRRPGVVYKTLSPETPRITTRLVWTRSGRTAALGSLVDLAGPSRPRSRRPR